MCHPLRLRSPDRAIVCCKQYPKNRAKLTGHRQKRHGRATATRTLLLHALPRRPAGGFDMVCIEEGVVS